MALCVANVSKGMNTGWLLNAGRSQVFLDQLGNTLSTKGLVILIEKQLVIAAVVPESKVALDSRCCFLLKLDDPRSSAFTRSYPYLAVCQVNIIDQ